MNIYAAIDLKNGHCVRLVQGDPNAETVYGNDPAAMAEKWAALGTDWLHVVNLDGALDNPDKAAKNIEALQAILSRVTVPVQFGGGLRSVADVQRALAMGVSRVVLGSVAVERPDLMLDLLTRFGPERIALGLDVREGKVAAHGWQQLSQADPVQLAQSFQTAGLYYVIHTDISRDGMLTGANVEASAALARAAGVKVIVSGGVASLEDVQRVKAAESAGLEGLIIGKALYTGAVELGEAMRIARGQTTPI